MWAVSVQEEVRGDLHFELQEEILNRTLRDLVDVDNEVHHVFSGEL